MAVFVAVLRLACLLTTHRFTTLCFTTHRFTTLCFTALRLTALRLAVALPITLTVPVLVRGLAVPLPMLTSFVAFLLRFVGDHRDGGVLLHVDVPRREVAERACSHLTGSGG